MTLGRTSSGSIKVKADSAGGGLRAVSCACCGSECSKFFPSTYCDNQYDATAEEYNAWRRGGVLNFSISWSVENIGSVSASDTIIVPPNSCLIGFSSGDFNTDESVIGFGYGFLEKEGGGYSFVYSSRAGLDFNGYVQTMGAASFDYLGEGNCNCATAPLGPYPPTAFVAGRPFCPDFFSYDPEIIANITFTPNPE